MSYGSISLYCVIVLCLCGCAEPGPIGKLRPDVKFNIYTVAQTPAEPKFSVYDPVTESTLHLREPPIVTSADVVGVELLETPEGERHLHVSVSDPASERLFEATSRMGDCLAVVVNGVLICAPRIQAQIRSDFQITTGNSDKVDWPSLIEQIIDQPIRRGSLCDLCAERVDLFFRQGGDSDVIDLNAITKAPKNKSRLSDTKG